MFALDEDGRAALRAESLGFVFQSFQLLPHLNALENVLLPLELTGRTPDDASPVDAARNLLQRVGLGERLSHYPKYLSGGEQQRVALARAFVLRPPLLLADEPTGSLDARTGEAVIDLMFELNRERGSTLLLVTHDPDIARRCARQIELHAGRVVARYGRDIRISGRSPDSTRAQPRQLISSSRRDVARSQTDVTAFARAAVQPGCSQRRLPRFEVLREQATQQVPPAHRRCPQSQAQGRRSD